MKYGYARVSTDDQKADLQINALKKAGCDYIFTDTVSGTVKKRQELNRCLESLRDRDALIVWKLDRLGRSLSAASKLLWLRNKNPYLIYDSRAKNALNLLEF